MPSAVRLIGIAILCTLVVGCSSVDSRSGSEPQGSTAPAETSGAPVPVLPAPRPFIVEEFEPAAEVKQAAVDFLEAALTFTAEEAEVPARARI